MSSVPEFRALTRLVIAAEKPGFWSDWTTEQQRLYQTGNWKAFSQSRGYSSEEIADFEKWLGVAAEFKTKGLNPWAIIHDLAVDAAMRNIGLDVREEISLSSHCPNTGGWPCPG